jgi:hypothetical protein
MLLMSVCLGPNVLHFNNGWFLDMETLLRAFPHWRLVDYLVDNHSSEFRSRDADARRFVKERSTEGMKPGQYRVAFLHLER